MKKIIFWLKNSRLFSLPMTLLSWLTVFAYSYLGGDILNGLLALLGISCAHLATNLFDDYVDYKDLSDNCQKCKCLYLKEGKADIYDVLRVVILYLFLASVIGFVLFLRCGINVIYMAVIGGLITLLYSKFSKLGFSELAVGIAFGPLLFEGVYYVMHETFSFEVLILSLSVVMFTIGLMYVHTVLDFDGDMASGKMTLVCRLNNKQCAIDGVFVVYGLGFLFTIILAFLLKNYYLFLNLVLVPLIFDLHRSLKGFSCTDSVSEFYYRLLKARNLMIYNSLIITFSILFFSVLNN